MARYGPEHKQATRRRMIDTAGRRFRTDGFDGAGIATLVSDAGLTNGAFYGHFSSKDALIADVLADLLDRQAEQIEAMPVSPASVGDFIDQYLSTTHRDDLGGGCPSAALLDEVGRRDQAIRSVYTAGASRLVAALAHHLDADDTLGQDEARSRAIGVLTLLVGALQSARAVDDPTLSQLILTTSRSHARSIAGLPTTSLTAPATDQDVP